MSKATQASLALALWLLTSGAAEAQPATPPSPPMSGPQIAAWGRALPLEGWSLVRTSPAGLTFISTPGPMEEGRRRVEIRNEYFQAISPKGELSMRMSLIADCERFLTKQLKADYFDGRRFSGKVVTSHGPIVGWEDPGEAGKFLVTAICIAP